MTEEEWAQKNDEEKAAIFAANRALASLPLPAVTPGPLIPAYAQWESPIESTVGPYSPDTTQLLLQEYLEGGPDLPPSAMDLKPDAGCACGGGPTLQHLGDIRRLLDTALGTGLDDIRLVKTRSTLWGIMHRPCVNLGTWHSLLIFLRETTREYYQDRAKVDSFWHELSHGDMGIERLKAALQWLPQALCRHLGVETGNATGGTLWASGLRQMLMERDPDAAELAARVYDSIQIVVETKDRDHVRFISSALKLLHRRITRGALPKPFVDAIELIEDRVYTIGIDYAPYDVVTGWSMHD